jgi:transcriptional regulator of arginine metabolism
MQKQLRHGQILKLLAAEPIESHDALRRRLAPLGVRVTQATLSRDLRELGLVKTAAGYRQMPAGEAAAGPSALESVCKEFLRDIRPAQNILVLKTPPGGAQPLAAALDACQWKQVAGTVAGDDTVLIVTPSRNACATLRKRLEDMVR